MRDTPGRPAPVAWPGRRSVLTLALGMGVGLPPARLVGAQEGDARRAPLADLPSGRAPLTAYPMDANLKAGARLLNGPAPRRLPALPLKVADGFPVVAGAFIGRPGFESEGG